MQKKLLLYVTMPERCVVENLLARASEVEVKTNPTGEPKKCLRIGLGNGHYTKFFHEFCEFAEIEGIEAEKFLGTIIARLKQAGMIKKVADHKDCPQFGILELLIKQEEIMLVDIESRTARSISGTMSRLLDGLTRGVSVFDSFPPTAKAILGILTTDDDCNRLRWRLTRAGVIIRLELDPDERLAAKKVNYWLIACSQFLKHTFVSDGQEEEWAQSLDGVKVAGSPERLQVLVFDFLTSRRADLEKEFLQKQTTLADCLEKFVEAQQAMIAVINSGDIPDSAELVQAKAELEKAEQEAGGIKPGQDNALLEKYEAVIADLSLQAPKLESVKLEDSVGRPKSVASSKPTAAASKPKKGKQPAKKPGRKKQPSPDPEKIISSPWFKNLTLLDRVMVCVFLKFGRERFSSLQMVDYIAIVLPLTKKNDVTSALSHLYRKRKQLKSSELTTEMREELGLPHQVRHMYQLKLKVFKLVKAMIKNAE
ncbi:hypothetical protein HN858_04680 [Candidatus Falkowbacteria bacterium]|nr:hypothetical protein [Candidatus Falkowbacteria bacterium]MBT5502608.1 hypothetical protein [Candidatus Falkowbacteria bacterium]MBT6574583.1 hypothetical protein [Candidatus Falkowbacteria bacterium]MBT7348937.1 hypothetical protein [Candidatus Falkowbacteria bacterium]MBT7500336.1 hypothetical protein [Candidatus Falkowbacteria bacterium]